MDKKRIKRRKQERKQEQEEMLIIKAENISTWIALLYVASEKHLTDMSFDEFARKFWHDINAIEAAINMGINLEPNIAMFHLMYISILSHPMRLSAEEIHSIMNAVRTGETFPIFEDNL